MAITATLCFTGKNRLRYLVASTTTSADSVTITTTGAATPDISTDTTGENGPLRNMVKAFANGYGKLAAGALTQAQARAIWLADNSGADIGNSNIQRATCKLTKRAGNGQAAVDANVDGSGHPTIIVSTSDTFTGYLDIIVGGAIGA